MTFCFGGNFFVFFEQALYVSNFLTHVGIEYIGGYVFHTLTVSVSGISVKIRSRLLSSLTDRLLKSWLALLMIGMAASGKQAAPVWAAQIT